MGEIYGSVPNQTMGHPCLAGNSSQSKRRAEWRRDPLWLEEHDYCLASGPKLRPLQYFSKLPDYLVQLKLEFVEVEEEEEDSETGASPTASTGSSTTLSCSPAASSPTCLSSSSSPTPSEEDEESPTPLKSSSTNSSIQERRVLFVGKLPDNTTEEDMRRRFHRFGVIEKVSIYFRKNADNYGFVTFQDSSSTYDAYQNGNNDPNEPKVDLCFGERRQFCSRKYMDLDAVSGPEQSAASLDFDCLLKQALKSKSTATQGPSSILW